MVLINLYKNQDFTQRLDDGKQPVEISVQDRIFFEVKLNTDDQRLTVFAENCSVTPTSNKDDPRRYYLTQRGCKQDPTLQNYASPPNAHRMSYESFSFVGIDDPVTYLQCDVSICDNQAPDRRCRDRKCLDDDGTRRRRRSHGYIREASHVSRGLVVHSTQIVLQKSQRHSRRARSVSELSTAQIQDGGHHSNLIGKLCPKLCSIPDGVQFLLLADINLYPFFDKPKNKQLPITYSLD